MSAPDKTKADSTPWYTARLWHGMTLGIWRRMLGAHGYRVSPSRLPLAASATIGSSILSLGRGLEELLHGRQTKKATIERPPLFVIGHWRTGTTLMHELLILDEQYTFPTTYQCMSPHNFLHTAWVARMFFRFLLPNKRPMDNMPMSWDLPQEDEFALCNLGLKSPYLNWAYPDHYGEYDDYLDLKNLTTEDREQWKKTLVRFLTRVSIAREGRLVMKSPTHTARIRTLLECFPDAQFIHMVRDPMKVVPSTRHTWQQLEDHLWLNRGDKSRRDEHLFELGERMYQNFDEDRSLIADQNICDVRFEDLVANPLGEMERVYDHLTLGDYSAIRPPLEKYFADKKDYRRNKLDLDPQLAEEIRHRWANYIERYGYTPKSTDDEVALSQAG